MDWVFDFLTSLAIVFVTILLTCGFLYTIIQKQGIKKFTSILWWVSVKAWIVLAIDEAPYSVFDIICFWVFLLELTGISIQYMKKKEREKSVAFAIGVAWVAYILDFCMESLNKEHYVLGMFFKICFFVVIVFFAKEISLYGYKYPLIWYLLLYVFLIVSCVVFSPDFMFSDIEKLRETVYQVVGRLYTLPQLKDGQSTKYIIWYIVDFFMCRIMDMAVLSFLINVMMNDNKSDKCESEKMV